MAAGVRQIGVCVQPSAIMPGRGALCRRYRNISAGTVLNRFPFALARAIHSNSLFDGGIHRSGDAVCANDANPSPRLQDTGVPYETA